MEKSIDKNIKEIKRINSIIKILRKNYSYFDKPAVTEISETKDVFKVLVSTIISARTKDKVTLEASKRLFSIADTPHKIIRLGSKKIEKLIYPAGFYRTKAKNILKTSKIIVKKYNGSVPKSLEQLISLPGVGRKTANLVIILGYKKKGICVDTHVHKISNRLAIVRTKNPLETELELRKILPKKFWMEYNDLLVTFGQNICRPLSPFCTSCPIEMLCPKIGIKKYR